MLPSRSISAPGKLQGIKYSGETYYSSDDEFSDRSWGRIDSDEEEEVDSKS